MDRTLEIGEVRAVAKIDALGHMQPRGVASGDVESLGADGPAGDIFACREPALLSSVVGET